VCGKVENMTNRLRVASVCVALAMSLTCGYRCAAQKFKPVPPAPVPSRIIAAKKVFIANGGGDESVFDWPQYSGGPNRLYDELYAALKSWGRYELASTPGEAELVFEIRLTNFQPHRSEPLGEQNVQYDSQFRLTIRDVQTHETLWGLTEHAQTAILQGNRDKNFEVALGRILAELKRIGGPAQVAAKR